MKEFIKKLLGEKILSLYHYLWALLSAGFYGFPGKKIKTIAITGTKGKTSTAYLLYHILNSAGIKSGLLTTAVWSFDGEKITPNTKHMTMPGRAFLQKSLRKMLKNNCQVAIIETTSEGIKQHRHKFIYPDTTIFTNLHPEHIQSHGSFEKYKQAKGKLFALNPEQVLIANKDDENFEYFFSFPAKTKKSYGKHPNTDYTISDIKVDLSHTHFKINDTEFTLPLIGEFFSYNTAAAVAATEEFGVNLDSAAEFLKKVPQIPGRMQEIYVGQDFRVFIDYAHEPYSFEKALKTARKLAGGNQLIAVFGATGGIRDKQKRPLMGKIADKYANVVILTDDDPYDEDSQQIIDQIKQGIKNKTPQETLFEIINRAEAIKKAINLANPGDVVIILGKGAETYIIKNGKRIPHSDEQVAKEAIKDILKEG